ncbi:hypothetical protein NIES4074_61340 (plasmid) [Cylindrospermum sp. NIES-4074]|nr:hypothetical protein NIES4074_61340 [Cylindrospermum sp. NIES-4074]
MAEKHPTCFILCITPLILLIGVVYVVMALIDTENSDDKALYRFVKTMYSLLERDAI